MSRRVDRPLRLFPDEPRCLYGPPTHSPITQRNHVGQFGLPDPWHCNLPARVRVLCSCPICGIRSCNGSTRWIARNVFVPPRIVDTHPSADPAGNQSALSRALFVLSAAAHSGPRSLWSIVRATIVAPAASHPRLSIVPSLLMPMMASWRAPFTSSNIASASRSPARSPT